ncbi:alpha/beta hydrolase domain-containing protein VTE7-like [Bidens hawaiensis]|uniref:alpha/beta hydrolase domain-containing protein VTE7-like n=1 Tax=Bidens hawaiensis TaxID=980011 RepID=UPI00404A0439
MLKIATITSAVPSTGILPVSNRKTSRLFRASPDVFPQFLLKEMEKIEDPFARKLVSRIEMLPVELSVSKNRVMTSCVKPIVHDKGSPLVLLHGFDSSCLEWRYTLPLLEQAGFEAWAIDILGWGFSNLETLPLCNVESKRDHLYQFWKSYINRPMLLVGPSLGASAAVDFAINHPEAVDKLILINASVYAKGTGNLSTLPRSVAFAGVSLLKSLPLRFYATNMGFTNLPFATCLEWTCIARLHCLLPWWEEATVDFMRSGGYDVSSQIDQVLKKTLIIYGENDRIVDSKLAVRLHCELPNAIIRQIPNCGHVPHVENPDVVANLITDFVSHKIH